MVAVPWCVYFYGATKIVITLQGIGYFLVFFVCLFVLFNLGYAHPFDHSK